MSGKGKDIPGLYDLTCKDIFKVLDSPNYKHLSVAVSYFEIYGGRLFDLLNSKKSLQLLEDKNQNAQVVGLKEVNTKTLQELLNAIATVEIK